MTQKLRTLGFWQQTRNSLYDALGVCSERLETVPWSEDPASDHVRLNAAEDLIGNSIKAHAILGLKLIDDAIAQSGLIDRIKAASADAKKEADRIKNATKTVNEIVAVVEKVAGVVSLFGQIATL